LDTGPRRGFSSSGYNSMNSTVTSLSLWSPPEVWWADGVRFATAVAQEPVAFWVWLQFWLLGALGWFAVFSAVGASVLASFRLAIFLWAAFWGLVVRVVLYSTSPVWVLFCLLWPAFPSPRAELSPAVPEWVQCDGFGQPKASEGSLTENGIEVVNEFRSVPVSAHLCARPRRRAVWVRRLEVVLGVAPGVVGQLVRGRWRPDLPSSELSLGANLILSHFEDGARILGGGSVLAKDRGFDGVSSEAYLIVELADGSREVVFPGLVSSLAAYAFLRERSATLVGALRSRAVEWFKGRSLSSDLTWAGLSGSFRFAWHVSPRELRAQEMLACGPSPPFWWSSA